MVQSFIRGLSKWPTADLAELLLSIKAILDERARNHIEHEAKRAKTKRVGGRSAK